MALRVVFLDRASIIANVRRPRAASDYIEYQRSEESELVERLRGATVAITNKVPLRAAVLRQLPQLRMIAVAATGYDVVDIGYFSETGSAVGKLPKHTGH